MIDDVTLYDDLASPAAAEFVFQEVVEHLFWETPFDDYTVSEGLSLLTLLLFLFFCVGSVLRRCFFD